MTDRNLTEELDDLDRRVKAMADLESRVSDLGGLADRVDALETVKSSEGAPALSAAIESLRKEVASVQAKFAKVEMLLPPEHRALSYEQVGRLLKVDSHTEFELLAEFRNSIGDTLPAGRKLRADIYPSLHEYVRAGMMVGLVQSMDDLIEDTKRLRDANVQAAEANERAARAKTALATAKLAVEATEADAPPEAETAAQ